jgi:phosphate-selective porin OprO/OprP
VRSPLSKGGLGSLDLLARYDFADLTDVRDSALTEAGRSSARRAGDYSGLTLGAIWRPEPGFRVVLNLSEARVEYARPQPDVRIRLLQLRAQYDF